jgi:hypothetical protein
LLLHIQLPGGLAVKIDDNMIELAHQPWKRQKERTWNPRNYEMQQKSQLKAVGEVALQDSSKQ